MSAILGIVGNDGRPAKPTSVEPITCTVEVVTPMFIAGVNPKEQDPKKLDREGLRVGSVKGILRSWWRLGQMLPTVELARLERKLWGGLPTKLDPNPSRGPTIRTLMVKNAQGSLPRSAPPIASSPGSAAFYLGYGAVRNQNKPEENPGKCRWEPGSCFALEILHDGRSGQQEAIQQSLQWWHAFGGCGSRSRRSWGSMVLRGTGCLPACRTPDELVAQLRGLLPRGTAPTDRPSLCGARVEVAPMTFKDHPQAVERLFTLFKGEGKSPGVHKGCWAFGLPWQGKNAQPNPPKLPTDQNRRASPIILKLHPLIGGGLALVAIRTTGPFHPFADPGRMQMGRLDDFLDLLCRMR